jgi:predicted ATPase/class 3 adenylate cyclase
MVEIETVRTLPAGTVTLMFTDIEGSTRLLRDLGPDAYGRALGEHRRCLRAAFTAHSGVEVDTQGDAFFVAFPSAEAAAVAAAEANRALDPGPVRVRIGLDTGTPAQAEGTYVGEVVHRAARIAALAHGGQVLLSAATRELLYESVEVTHLGRHRLKDFSGTVPLYQLGSESFSPLRSRGSLDLPHPATAFLGRGRELFDAVRIIGEHDPQILTVLGPGGSGKTRFAIELGRRLGDTAEGGTVFVPLAPLRDPDLVLPVIASAVGASRADNQTIAARIGEKRTHLLLDNIEQLLPEAAVTLATLCFTASPLRLIVTSREALRIDAEEEFDLPPLAVEEAADLFMTRARVIRPDLERSPAVNQLCLRLDLMPLALELAAARVKLLTPQALLDRLSSRLDLLTGRRDAEPRHATLRTTIGWSYDLLDATEKSLFERLSVFRGGCTLDAAEVVCAADFQVLEALLDKSLLRRRTDDPGADRFWMHESIREFATERCARSPGQQDLCHAHARWLLGLLARGDITTDMHRVRSVDELDLADRELDNIRAALEWTLQHDPVLGLELTVSLEQFWLIRQPVEGETWHRRLLDAAPTASPLLRAGGLRAHGLTKDIVGEYQAAEALYREGLDLLDFSDDTVMTPILRFHMAAAAVHAGEGHRVWPLIDEALATFQRNGWPVRTGQALGYLSMKACDDGDLEKAVALRSESRALMHQAGATFMEARDLYVLAALERDAGNLAAATDAARRSAALAEQLRDPTTAVFATAELACVAAAGANLEAAGRLWGAIEAAEEGPPLGIWPEQRAAYVETLSSVRTPAFERGQTEGHLLSLAEAVATGLDEESLGAEATG